MPHAGLSTSETGDLLGFSQPALEFKKTGLRKVNAHWAVVLWVVLCLVDGRALHAVRKATATKTTTHCRRAELDGQHVGRWYGSRRPHVVAVTCAFKTSFITTIQIMFTDALQTKYKQLRDIINYNNGEIIHLNWSLISYGNIYWNCHWCIYDDFMWSQ